MPLTGTNPDSHVTESLTLPKLHAMKRAGEKISSLTVYDASFSLLLDKIGIDILLVGDSLGMVIQGHHTTLPVTLEAMLYHTRCVTHQRTRAFVIADLPFMTYSTPSLAAANAARLLQEGGAQMVKLEGARYETISFLVAQGIPVCGHLGLLPQSINLLGEFKTQGKNAADAAVLLNQAKELEAAGASLLVIECVPATLARQISQQLSIPVIGIGAGVDCDGQILVLYDMLHITQGKLPRFAKNFMSEAPSIEAAIVAYHQAVKQSQFPGPEHSV